MFVSAIAAAMVNHGTTLRASITTLAILLAQMGLTPEMAGCANAIKTQPFEKDHAQTSNH